MSPALAVANAAVFVWLGMVLAISFLEAPLKFRARDVTLPIGLGIGRIVFRALNTAEIVLAALVAAGLGLAIADVGTALVITAAVPVVVLVAQLVFVRPTLTRRSNRVLAGHTGERSRAHLVYVALEVVKVVGLLVAGVMLLGS